MRFRIFFSLLALLIFGSNSAHAISVGPAIIEIQANTDSVSDSSFVVTNEESEALSYAFTIQKFVPSGQEGQAQFLPLSDTEGLPDWLYLDSSTLTLKPGESKRIAVTLKTPTNASPGGHYAAIFLTQTNLGSSAEQAVSAIPKIGVLVFVRINGTIVEKTVLQDFKTNQSWYSSLPVHFEYSLNNQGNIHVQPKVAIEVQNMFGNTVAKINGNPDMGRILPGSIRHFTFHWQKDTYEQKKGFWNGVKFEFYNFGLGFYTAHIVVSTQNVANTSEANIAFQVWPWRLALVLLVTIIGLLIVLKFIQKLLRKE